MERPHRIACPEQDGAPCPPAAGGVKRPRAPRFLFEPGDFETDPVVLAMSPAGRGAYIMLLCRAWAMPEPGVIPAAPERTVANLAMIDFETWQAVKSELAEAFDTESRPGFWIQKRMVATHRLQTDRIKMLESKSTAGGKARAQSAMRQQNGAFAPAVIQQPLAGAGKTLVQRSASDTPAHPAGLGLGLGLGEDVQECSSVHTRKHSPSNDAEKPPRAQRAESASAEKARATRQASATFDAKFWPRYPRKVGRAAALKAFVRRVRSPDDWRAVNAGLDHWLEVWTRDETEDRFIPHASTWLNQERYRDAQVSPRASPLVAEVEQESPRERMLRLRAERNGSEAET